MGGGGGRLLRHWLNYFGMKICSLCVCLCWPNLTEYIKTFVEPGVYRDLLRGLHAPLRVVFEGVPQTESCRLADCVSSNALKLTNVNDLPSSNKQ